MLPSREPWNPFDTADSKISFPELDLALAPGSGSAPVLDVELLAQRSPAHIDAANPQGLGYLEATTTQKLESECQAWFDSQQLAKAARGDSPTPSCSFSLPGIPYIAYAERRPSGGIAKQQLPVEQTAAQQQQQQQQQQQPLTASPSSRTGQHISPPHTVHGRQPQGLAHHPSSFPGCFDAQQLKHSTQSTDGAPPATSVGAAAGQRLRTDPLHHTLLGAPGTRGVPSAGMQPPAGGSPGHDAVLHEEDAWPLAEPGAHADGGRPQSRLSWLIHRNQRDLMALLESQDQQQQPEEEAGRRPNQQQLQEQEFGLYQQQQQHPPQQQQQQQLREHHQQWQGQWNEPQGHHPHAEDQRAHVTPLGQAGQGTPARARRDAANTAATLSAGRSASPQSVPRRPPASSDPGSAPFKDEGPLSGSAAVSDVLELLRQVGAPSTRSPQQQQLLPLQRAAGGGEAARSPFLQRRQRRPAQQQQQEEEGMAVGCGGGLWDVKASAADHLRASFNDSLLNEADNEEEEAGDDGPWGAGGVHQPPHPRHLQHQQQCPQHHQQLQQPRHHLGFQRQQQKRHKQRGHQSIARCTQTSLCVALPYTGAAAGAPAGPGPVSLVTHKASRLRQAATQELRGSSMRRRLSEGGRRGVALLSEGVGMQQVGMGSPVASTSSSSGTGSSTSTSSGSDLIANSPSGQVSSGSGRRGGQGAGKRAAGGAAGDTSSLDIRPPREGDMCDRCGQGLSQAAARRVRMRFDLPTLHRTHAGKRDGRKGGGVADEAGGEGLGGDRLRHECDVCRRLERGTKRKAAREDGERGRATKAAATQTAVDEETQTDGGVAWRDQQLPQQKQLHPVHQQQEPAQEQMRQEQQQQHGQFAEQTPVGQGVAVKLPGAPVQPPPAPFYQQQQHATPAAAPGPAGAAAAAADAGAQRQAGGVAAEQPPLQPTPIVGGQGGAAGHVVRSLFLGPATPAPQAAQALVGARANTASTPLSSSAALGAAIGMATAAAALSAAAAATAYLVSPAGRTPLAPPQPPLPPQAPQPGDVFAPAATPARAAASTPAATAAPAFGYGVTPTPAVAPSPAVLEPLPWPHLLRGSPDARHLSPMSAYGTVGRLRPGAAAGAAGALGTQATPGRAYAQVGSPPAAAAAGGGGGTAGAAAGTPQAAQLGRLATSGHMGAHIVGMQHVDRTPLRSLPLPQHPGDTRGQEAAQRLRFGQQEASQQMTAAAATALAAACGPASIPSRFFPPSAKKVMTQAVHGRLLPADYLSRAERHQQQQPQRSPKQLLFGGREGDEQRGQHRGVDMGGPSGTRVAVAGAAGVAGPAASGGAESVGTAASMSAGPAAHGQCAPPLRQQWQEQQGQEGQDVREGRAGEEQKSRERMAWPEGSPPRALAPDGRLQRRSSRSGRGQSEMLRRYLTSDDV